MCSRTFWSEARISTAAATRAKAWPNDSYTFVAEVTNNAQLSKLCYKCRRITRINPCRALHKIKRHLYPLWVQVGTAPSVEHDACAVYPTEMVQCDLIFRCHKSDGRKVKDWHCSWYGDYPASRVLQLSTLDIMKLLMSCMVVLHAFIASGNSTCSSVDWHGLPCSLRCQGRSWSSVQM